MEVGLARHPQLVAVRQPQEPDAEEDVSSARDNGIAELGAGAVYEVQAGISPGAPAVSEPGSMAISFVLVGWFVVREFS